jgi:hypothetical protein
MFEDAAARDPAYAPAFVGMAESLNMLANYGFMHPREIRPRSLAAARRALELDPNSAEAHRFLEPIELRVLVVRLTDCESGKGGPQARSLAA